MAFTQPNGGLFQRDKSVISKHIKNIFEEGRINRQGQLLQILQQFKRKATRRYNGDWVYNLDVIIAVGYRVKSARGTQFRIWATQRLKEYLVKVSRWMTSV